MASKPSDLESIAPDAASRARAALIGPNAAYYLAAINPGARHGFNFAALCFGPAWLMYRRMPVAAALFSLAVYLLAMVLPELAGLALLAPVALGLTANRLYLAQVEATLRAGGPAGVWRLGATLGAFMLLMLAGFVIAALAGVTIDPDLGALIPHGEAASAPLTLLQRLIMVLVAVAPGLALVAILALPYSDHHLAPWLAPALAGGLIAMFGVYPPIMIAIVFAGGWTWLADQAAWAMATLGSGVPEEAAKLAALLLVVLPMLRAAPSPAALVAITGLIGASFGVLENLSYVMAGREWAATALVRAIWSVPFHGFNGVVMGALAAAAMARGSRRGLVLAWGLPAALHAAFNYPLFVLEQEQPELPPLAAEMLFLAAVCALTIAAARALAAGPAEPHRHEPALARWVMAAAAVTCALPLVLALSPGGLRWDWTSAEDGIGLIMLAAACIGPFAMAALLWATARRLAR